jgi:15-cis-phytoene desaturase
MGRSVIVVGSGLAGLSCALDLAIGKADVTVLEASGTLGGRSSSWVQDGMPVESGLHKYLGIYRALPELMKRVGVEVEEMITWTDELTYYLTDGVTASFVAAPYRHPLGTLYSAVANTDFLPIADQAKLAAMTMAGVFQCHSNPLELDDISIAEYAASYGVSAETIERVISTSTRAILFLPAEEFSAYAALAPVAEGLRRGLTMRIGAFKSGMTDVMMTPIAQKIADLGGRVRLNASVKSLISDGGRVMGVMVGDEMLLADHVVLAVPLAPAQLLVKGVKYHSDSFEAMLRLPSLSAVSIQFELDKPLLDDDRTNFSPTSICCFAEQSRTTFRETKGRLSAIVYPPAEFIESNDEHILAHVLEDADRLRLPLRRLIRQFRVIRHPFDFYAMRPGTERLRPTQATSIPGLSLAGDYTKQPFSASMEGAVVSGQQAAQAVLKAI